MHTSKRASSPLLARALVEEAETVPNANASAPGGRAMLVTTRARYVGSHAVLQLLLRGFHAIIIDNIHNSKLAGPRQGRNRGKRTTGWRICWAKSHTGRWILRGKKVVPREVEPPRWEPGNHANWEGGASGVRMMRRHWTSALLYETEKIICRNCKVEASSRTSRMRVEGEI